MQNMKELLILTILVNTMNRWDLKNLPSSIGRWGRPAKLQVFIRELGMNDLHHDRNSLLFMNVLKSVIYASAHSN